MKLLRTLLPIIESYCSLLNFVLLIIYIGINFKAIIEFFKKIEIKTWKILIIIILVGFLIRFLTPWYHLVYFDEFDYMEGARSILIENKYGFCGFGNLGNCHDFYMQPHPIGYPFVVSLAYYLFGISEIVAMSVNLFFSILSIFLIFGVSYLLFDNESISLWSSFFLSLFPIHVMFSTSASPEVFSSAFILLSIFSFLLYIKNNKRMEFLIMGLLSLSYMVSIRPENILFSVICFLILKSYKGIETENLMKPDIVAFFLVFLISSSLIVLHIFFSKSNWTHNNNIFSMNFIKKNLNYIEFWTKKYNPILLFPLFLLGIYISIKKHKKEILLLGSWLFGFLFLYIIYASFTNRFMLQIISPYIILSSLGVYYIKKSIKKLSKYFFIFLACILVLSNFLALYFIYLPDSEILNEHNTFSREEVFLKDVKDEVRDCYIIASSPFFINFLINEKSIDITRINDIRNLIETEKCVVFYENFFCFQSQKESCERIHYEFDTTLIKSIRNNLYDISLYKVNLIKGDKDMKEGSEDIIPKYQIRVFLEEKDSKVKVTVKEGKGIVEKVELLTNDMAYLREINERGIKKGDVKLEKNDVSFLFMIPKNNIGKKIKVRSYLSSGEWSDWSEVDTGDVLSI